MELEESSMDDSWSSSSDTSQAKNTNETTSDYLNSVIDSNVLNDPQYNTYDYEKEEDDNKKQS